MKKIFSLALMAVLAMGLHAQGWPAGYQGVMLQGFYWDSFDDTKWTVLEEQADELAQYFSLVWVPQSGKCLESYSTMGYTPYYYFNQNSSFGTESELRSMIQTFKSKGLGTVADVVVNHHNTNGWFSFPAETYDGVTYQLQSTDIVADDDGGATKTQATNNGVELSQNNDEGDGWDGMRDLDHKSENVQTIVKAYVKYLKDDLGYTGFRYDMVKGFAASHVADYNDAAGIEYSVGECWDSNTTIKTWISGTSKKSAAFDFQLRYNVRDAINNDNWTLLNSTNNLISDASMRQWSVTFVENHDTEYRSASSQQDPLRKDTLAANAYLLAMPGTPTVFLKHWQACKQDIKAMIDVRKKAGISNTSTYSLYDTPTQTAFAVLVNGTNATLLAVVGPEATTRTVSSDYVRVLSGYKYAYYLDKSIETAWADKADGEYSGSVDVTLAAVSLDTTAKLVYTTDGSLPTATNGIIASSGDVISLTSSCTLTVGLLKDGTVSGIVSRNYTITEAYQPRQITVYVNADQATTAWSSAYTTATTPVLNWWTWGGEGTHAPTNSSWPGDQISDTETVGGVTWIKNTYTMTSEDDCVNFVWSVGTGSPQTEDVNSVSDNAFFLITSSTGTSGKFTVTNVTDQYTGIADVQADNATTPQGVYTISGRLVNKTGSTNGLPGGIYIINGRKIVK